jgi:hypothetical protein
VERTQAIKIAKSIGLRAWREGIRDFFRLAA